MMARSNSETTFTTKSSENGNVNIANNIEMTTINFSQPTDTAPGAENLNKFNVESTREILFSLNSFFIYVYVYLWQTELTDNGNHRFYSQTRVIKNKLRCSIRMGDATHIIRAISINVRMDRNLCIHIFTDLETRRGECDKCCYYYFLFTYK